GPGRGPVPEDGAGQAGGSRSSRGRPPIPEPPPANDGESAESHRDAARRGLPAPVLGGGHDRTAVVFPSPVSQDRPPREGPGDRPRPSCPRRNRRIPDR